MAWTKVGNLRGPEGPQGEPGPISTTPGPPGPPGKDGDTPTVEWDGPVLVVGGVSGPDLTGPQGVPGTVPTAADYMVVGPGRPDAPTTTGMTAAQLNALPVGAEYRSTDGASVGAWVWRKRPTGWVVTDGDTGWVVLPLVGTHHSLTQVEMKRQNGTVFTRAIVVPNGQTTGVLADVPSGFKAHHMTGSTATVGSISTSIRHGAAGASSVGTLYISATQVQFTDLTAAAQRHVARAVNDTDDPWPTTLPS